jgi:cyclopropane fatty-acyl-phospholipid synthase-like methyltransferase
VKREAPAAARNREPIADVLADELPASGTVLEIASGTGEHVVHFAVRFPQLLWQPSDPDESARASISAWVAEAGLANVRPPLALNAAADHWPIDHADAILCINMVHISPLEASEGLLAACERLLPPGAPLILYGPWLEEGLETAPSNLAFDEWLKGLDPRFCLRRTSWLDELAASHNMRRTRRYAMPANNIMLVYRRQ